MRFVYKPEGADPKSWDFKPEKLMNVEAEAIEKHTGMTFGEWTEKVGGGSMLAIHGLLYVMLKRSTPTLRWDDVQFCLDDIDFEIEDGDAEEIMRNLERVKAESGGLSSDDEALLESLRTQHATKKPDEAEDEAGPKDPAEPTSD